jgi:3-oxoacyl-[acyl-carrier-protein] synthase-1
MGRRQPVFLSALGIVSALGIGKEAVRRNLLAGTSPGVAPRSDLLVTGEPIHVGQVVDALPQVPDRLAPYESRNMAIVIAAVEQIRAEIDAARARHGPARIAVVMGTSTSGMAEGERAVAASLVTGKLPAGFDVRCQELGSPAEALAQYLGVGGLAYTVSTACSSSAHALAVGRRLLRTNLADAVVAGGADSLCRLTVNGFHALSALSKGTCNPFSRNRDGTIIGEGAAIFLMERSEAEIALYGVGTSSEAYSMTAPEPGGAGVEEAVRRALADAGLAAADIGYVQLHGTGTQHNDAVESKVILRVFGDRVPCSSSKAQVGHTLGAAGAIGAAHCWLAASRVNRDGLLPPHIWDGEAEEGLLSGSLVSPGQGLAGTSRRMFLSNAFAFGGNNVSLVIGQWE